MNTLYLWINIGTICLLINACGEKLPSLAGVDIPLIEPENTVQTPVECTDDPIILTRDDFNFKSEPEIQLDKACYQINQSLSLINGRTLTIMPGTVIQFAEKTSFSILGSTVIAEGTQSEPIVFTALPNEEDPSIAKPKGFWQGIHFHHNTTTKNSILKHVIIEYAGGVAYGTDDYGISLRLGGFEDISVKPPKQFPVQVEISHSKILKGGKEDANRLLKGVGLYIGLDVQLPNFSNNIIEGHTDTPVKIHSPKEARWLDSNTRYENNVNDYIFIIKKNLTPSNRLDVVPLTELTWKTLSVPYFLSNGLNLTHRLTLSPGSILLFNAQTELLVTSQTGILTAIGTPDRRIELSSIENRNGSWFGVRFHNTQPDNSVKPSTISTLKYVDIAFAGQRPGASADKLPRAALRLTTKGQNLAMANISDTNLYNSGGYGFYFDIKTQTDNFSNNMIWNNKSGAGLMYSNHLNQLLSGNDFTGNKSDKIDVRPITINADFSDDSGQTWPSVNIDYLFKDNMIVHGTLHIQPGARIRFAPNRGFQITGPLSTFIADGTLADKILISGELTHQPNKNWSGIRFIDSNNPANLINNVIIEFGGSKRGSSAYPPGNISVTENSFVQITNSHIASSGRHGIVVTSDSTMTETNNTFSNNAEKDIFRTQ